MTYNTPWIFAGIWLLTLSFSGCYSFKNISIDPAIQTFFVSNFDNRAASASPTFSQEFTEKLRDKIRNESRLTYNTVSPDIQIQGTIQDFRVTSIAPTEGNQTAFNRLEIFVRVEFENTQDEKENKEQEFSFGDDFPAEQNLLDIQDELSNQIADQLVEEIFNWAFNSW